MTDHPKRIRSEVLFAALAATGMFDLTSGDQVRRVVIDLVSGQVPVIHIEMTGDERLLDVVRSLDGLEVTRPAPPAGAVGFQPDAAGEWVMDIEHGVARHEDGHEIPLEHG